MTRSDSMAGLALEPLDPLFFRDGRPFGAATRGRSGLPQPQTLAGAVRTHLLAGAGFDFGRFRQLRRNGVHVKEALHECDAPPWVVSMRFRGPWLALKSGDNIRPLLPVPYTLRRNGKRVWSRMNPWQEPLPGWRGMDEMLPLWHSGDPDASYPGGFLTPDGVNRFLAGGCPTDEHWLESSALYALESRTCIGVDPDTYTAAEGMIYSLDLLALRHTVHVDESPENNKGICIYAECHCTAGPADWTEHLGGPIPFGGESRYVIGRACQAYQWKERPGEDRNVLLLATPAPLADADGKATWRPQQGGLGSVSAAATGPPVAVSGWDIARGGPRPTRFAIPPGSVYYTEGVHEPGLSSVCADPEDIAQGWGLVLRGAWCNGE